MTAKFQGLFQQFERSQPGPRFESLRRAARELLDLQVFPDAKTEDWRFTNVTPLLQQEFALPTTATVDAGMVPNPADPTGLRLVFTDGVFNRAFSTNVAWPPGSFVGPLSQAPVEALSHLGGIASLRDQVFSALNGSFLRDGAAVIVPAQTQVPTTVELLFLSTGAGAQVTFPRVWISLGAGSHARIVERYHGQGSAVAWTNAVTEIMVGREATLDHVKLHTEGSGTYHLANTQAVVATRGNLRTHSFLLGSKLTRNEVRVRFTGEHAQATVNGLYQAKGTQHIDNHTVIDHAMPHCASHELFKGILADKSHGVFNGKIYVRKDAQKTDAKQSNRVLLLSDEATINTKPQLEIFADDVKCTHGAAVGQLDATHMFYLQSRGIPREAARRLLTFAFANDVVSRVPIEPLRELLVRLITE